MGHYRQGLNKKKTSHFLLFKTLQRKKFALLEVLTSTPERDIQVSQKQIKSMEFQSYEWSVFLPCKHFWLKTLTSCSGVYFQTSRYVICFSRKILKRKHVTLCFISYLFQRFISYPWKSPNGMLLGRHSIFNPDLFFLNFLRAEKGIIGGRF